MKFEPFFNKKPTVLFLSFSPPVYSFSCLSLSLFCEG